MKLLIAGDGPHFSAVRARVHNTLQDRVQLLGHRNPVDVYHAADALLLPSAREGFSLVCAEGMSTGLPVLRTATAGTAELIVEGVTGRSTSIEHDAFLAAAETFLADPARLREMGHAAAAHIRGHLTFDRQLTDTLAMYRLRAGVKPASSTHSELA